LLKNSNADNQPRIVIAFARWGVMLISKCQRNNSRNQKALRLQKEWNPVVAAADIAVVVAVVAARVRPQKMI
jgi:hypothetical protein